MRNINWKDVSTKYPISFATLVRWLPNANLLANGTLLYSGNNLHYHYRFLPDFFDSYGIEWIVESDADLLYTGNVADYEKETFATRSLCESRFEAEMFCIMKAFLYLENKLKTTVN